MGTQNTLTSFEAARGRTLSYLRRGSGPLVVCVPGGPGMDPLAYFAAMELSGCELLIFAPRGTGDSSPPPDGDGYRMAGYVEDLESLRAHLGVETLQLYGNSHGGMVVLAYACRQPRHVERFAVANGPARMDSQFADAVVEARRRFVEAFPDGAERIAAADAAGVALDSESLGAAERAAAFRRLMARYVARTGPAETVYLDRLCSAPMNWEAAVSMGAEMLGGLDLLEGASLVEVPALVVAGEYDVTVPPAAMKLIAAALPAARYVEFPDVGHFVELEAPEAFSGLVSDFFRG